MVAYIAGSLPPSRQHAFEAHVLDCPLCEDALEGLQALDTPEKLMGIRDELIQRSQRPGISPAPVRNLFQGGYRIAAVLAVVLLGAAALNLLRPVKQDGQLALEKKKETISPAPSGEPDVGDFKDMNASRREPQPEKATPARQTLPPTESTTRTSATQPSAATATSATVQEDELNEEADVAEMTKTVQQEQAKPIQPPAVSSSSEGVTDKSNAAPAATVAAAERSTTTRPTSDRIKKEANTSWPDAMALFRAGRYGEALDLFKKEPGNPVALFHTGRCYFELQQPAEALRAMNGYITTQHPDYAEAAWWFKALSEKQLNDLPAAKKSLRKVIGFHGEYEQPAVRLLRTLP